ncbi:MAG: hypothetical protein GY829_12430 [Gammaproteobacteria bacterium]|nr:hypothetical protein [Gammaproteobacteria bacterium]
MFRDIFKDSDGKYCLAKMLFAICVIDFLVIVNHHEFTGQVTPLDYQGMALILTAVGATYGWRSHTKAGQK